MKPVVMSALVGFAVSFVPVAGFGQHIEVSPNRQLAVSHGYTLAQYPNNWRLWATRSDNQLYSSLTKGDPASTVSWVAHGGAHGTTKGVAALSWDDGGGVHERAYMVGSDALLWEYKLDNRGGATWISHSPPSGKQFTGYVTAQTALSGGGTRYIHIAFTTTDGGAWTGTKLTTDTPFAYANRGTGFRASTGLASTTSPDEAVVTFFATMTDYTLGWARWNSGWTVGNAGRPTNPSRNVCSAMAAAQGWVSPTSYRLHVWCTSFTAEPKLYVAYTTSPTSTSFTWAARNLGASSARSGNFAVAGMGFDYPKGEDMILDGFVVDVAGHIWRDRKTGTTWSAPLDLGKDGDSVENRGGLAAVGSNTISYVYSAASLGDSWYLNSRRETMTADYAFNTHGNGYTGLSWRTDPSSSPARHTESMLAEVSGKMIAVAIVRPDNEDGDGNGANDYAYNQAMWSTDDGATWGAAVDLPDNIWDGVVTFSYRTDPAAVMNSSGKAYVVQLGFEYAGNCDLTPGTSAVYYTTTTDGTNFSPTVDLDIAAGANFVDHPWVAIDRNCTPNRLHFIWTHLGGNGRKRYACMNEGATCANGDPCCPYGGCSTPPCIAEWQLELGGGAPIITVGGDGGVYPATPGGLFSACGRDNLGLSICRLDADFFDCEASPHNVAANLAPDDGSLSIPGEPGHYIRAVQGYSVAAAEDIRCPPSCADCGVVYYAFHKMEASCAAKDVYFSRGVYCKPTHEWTWSAPILVPTAHDDGKDEFNPSVTVTSDNIGGSGESTVFVSWYDRRVDCATVPYPNNLNRCIELRRRATADGGLTWGVEERPQVADGRPLTDPELLPFHCENPVNQRFIGDYNEGTSNLLHSHHVYSAAPEGAAPRTGELWQNLSYSERIR